MSSQAWQDFLNDLREATELLRADPSSAYSARTATGRAAAISSPRIGLTNALTKACVMLISGRLQGCIESQAEEFLECIDRSGVVVDQIPETLRASLCARYSPTRGTPSAAETAAVHKAYVTLWLTGQTLPEGTIKTDSLPDKVWNPWPDRVQTLLQRCEIDLYASIRQRHGSSYLANLKHYVGELIDFRNQVAHGSEPPSWTRSDVRLRMQWTTRLARACDTAFEGKLKAITGTGWDRVSDRESVGPPRTT